MIRSRTLPAVTLSVAALILTTASAGMANADSGPSAASAAGGSDASTKYCYRNIGNTGLDGVVSQNFEGEMDAADSSGAADFSLKSACTFKKVVARGAAGDQRPDSVTLTIYQNEGDIPGAVVTSQTVRGGDDPIFLQLRLKKITLPPGDYFVGVVANLGSQGAWLWSTTHQRGAGDVWINPGDGSGTGCTTWSDMVSCVGMSPKRPDFQVWLQKYRGGTPTTRSHSR